MCRLEPLSSEINRCEEEIDKCEWMKLTTLFAHPWPEIGPLTKPVGRLVAHGLKNGFGNVDMVQKRMRSWINPEQTVSLNHRYLPDWLLISFILSIYVTCGWVNPVFFESDDVSKSCPVSSRTINHYGGTTCRPSFCRVNPETMRVDRRIRFQYAMCGRGNFGVRKEKEADSKISRCVWTGP